MTAPELNEKERAEKLVRLEELKCAGEKAYDEMYDSQSPSGAIGCYVEAKDAFTDAMAVAKDLGLYQEWLQLVERLEHIKSVYRSQFSWRSQRYGPPALTEAHTLASVMIPFHIRKAQWRPSTSR